MLYYIEQDSNTFNQYNEVMSVALVTNEQVIKALRNYNPWWRNPSAAKEEDRPQHRVAYHETLRIMQHKTIRRFAVLSGARRVGKTTILYQIINHLIDNGVNPRNIFYATFDNPVLKMAGVDMVLSAYDSMYPVEGVRYVFFDEIQYTENWELWMKVIYDSRKDIRLAATGSASPIIEDASTDSGTGRWTVIKIPTLSFYEYCQLLQLDDMPLLPDHLKITDIPKMENAEVADLMARFEPLVKHFNRYLTIGGFPELALSDDDLYAQRMLREDVVDKVIKRDVLTLFKVRSPLLMEKLFLYLCMNSTEIFSATTAAKELDNISPNTIESYVDALVKSNLIYMAYPIAVGSKSVLKGRPKIYIADAAIRNAVLMVDDVLSDERELGLLIETTVYKHLVSFYQGTGAQLGYYRKAKENQKEVDAVIELPQQKILCEVKYKNNSHIPQTDGIVDLCNDPKAGITDAFVITKQLEDFGVTRHETSPKIYRIPAIAFLYLIGKEESDGMSGRL